MKTPDLKPCPFCGGEAKLDKFRVSFNDGYPKYDGFAVVVRCKTCKALSPYKRGTIHGSFKENEKEKAIDAWNRRATNETPYVNEH